MEIKNTTEYILTESDVMTACREFIQKNTSSIPKGRMILSIINEAVEPPAGVSDMGSPIYEFKGIRARVS